MLASFKEQLFSNKLLNFGPYELIQSKIGVGSLGEVHLVKRNNIEYAMKIVQFDMQDEEQQYDLINEVHIIKHLDAKYLCKSVDCFVNTNDEFCMVFPYAKNGDLLSYIEKNMPGQEIPEETLKDWIAQIALGLLELHSSNIMHRDIKPSNILVLDDGSLQIFDFGMAAKSGERPKRKRSFAGTYDYMAPELAIFKYDNQVDIYSLAISILQLANRKHSKHMTYANNFKTFAPNYSQQFNDLIWKMMNENPKTRPTAFQLISLDYLSETKPIKEYFSTKGSMDYAYGMINKSLQVISYHVSKQQRDQHSYLYMHEVESLIKQIDQLKSKMNNYQYHAKTYWDELCPRYDFKLIKKFKQDFNSPDVTGFYGINAPYYQEEKRVYRRIINDQYRDKPLVWTVKDQYDTSEKDHDQIQEVNDFEYLSEIMQVDKVISYQISESLLFNRSEKRQLWLQDSQEYLKNELKNVRIINSGMEGEMSSKFKDIAVLSILQHDTRRQIAANIVDQMYEHVEKLYWCCLVGQHQISYNLQLSITHFMDIEYCGFKVLVFVVDLTEDDDYIDLEEAKELHKQQQALEDGIVLQKQLVDIQINKNKQTNEV
eukprot:403361139